MRPALKADRLSTLGGLLAIILWSSTIAVTRSVSEQLGPLTAGAGVYLVGGSIALLWTMRSRPRAKASALSSKYLGGCGLLFVLYTVLLYVAVGAATNRAQTLEIGIVNYLWPAFTILFSLPLLRQRARPLLGVGTVLALLGVFVVMTQGAEVSWLTFTNHVQGTPVPYLLALGAAVAWALYSNLARRWAPDSASGATGWFIAATGVVLLCGRLSVTEVSSWSTRAVLESIFLGSVTAVAYLLWERAMRRGDLLLVAACSYLTPLLSTAVSSAYLGVQANRQLWLGCVVLVAGSLMSWWSIKTQPTSKCARQPATEITADY